MAGYVAHKPTAMVYQPHHTMHHPCIEYHPPTHNCPPHTTPTHNPTARAIRCLATTTHQHELVTWVHKHGGTVSPTIDVVAWGGDDGGSGFGLGATAVVASGTQLIMLPSALHLTYSEDPQTSTSSGSSTSCSEGTPPTPPTLRALIRQVPQELWGGKLALQLLAQRALGNGSLWAPYIRNLPVGFAGVPMFFGGEELGALQYPPVVEQVKKRCRWLLSFAGGALGEVAKGAEHPFQGAHIDANALGMLFFGGGGY